MAFDYKKAYREYYMPGRQPAVVKIPKMNFVAVSGKGDPNQPNGAYRQAMELLYAVSYTIRMSKKAGWEIPDFFEYVVPPLEGFWWQEGSSEIDFSRKEDFCWISMIRLPEFVTKKEFDHALSLVETKKKLDCGQVEFLTYNEGWCVQCMHVGPYDREAATLEQMKEYAVCQGYEMDLSHQRYHHEIYLSDPRRCDPEKLRTVIRCPVRLAGDQADERRLSPVREQLFSIEELYEILRQAAEERHLVETQAALSFAVLRHAHQYRRGQGHVPYIYHPLMVAVHGYELGICRDDFLAAALLHDVCEDCGVSVEELPVEEGTQKIVRLLTMDDSGNDRNEAKAAYYRAIAQNPEATLLKLLDRCNNLTGTASGFSRRRLVNYILDTEKYVLPLLAYAEKQYPQYGTSLLLIRYQLTGLLETQKAMLVR